VLPILGSHALGRLLTMEAAARSCVFSSKFLAAYGRNFAAITFANPTNRNAIPASLTGVSLYDKQSTESLTSDVNGVLVFTAMV